MNPIVLFVFYFFYFYFCQLEKDEVIWEEGLSMEKCPTTRPALACEQVCVVWCFLDS